ncbi:MAG: hypothetical protein OdinLCB4_007640 [Candidatus Odinarchaeum yellowstonii]|uniref:Uncharacterized protein n=1 Tax=Odinarchaeota yellowstonii (strain LCB_4) TaxID=1841599 RepID=A0AAF0IBE9_ODILC|nr:MAG: hypothetical protein OdinLCB4_007640 [Candidatus Odinarchaeum yellowstonii]
MEDETQKAVRVLARIKDYFLEAIDKFSKTVNEATKTLTDSLKRIEKDLKSIELGSLPASEKATSTSVITTVLAKRGEIISPEDLWSVLMGKPAVQPAAVQQAAAPPPPITTPVAPPPPIPEAKPPTATTPPRAPEFKPVTPTPPPAPPVETPVKASPPPTIPASVPSIPAAPVEEEAVGDQTSVSSLKNEMLKELKRLKKLMTGMT